MAFKTFAPGVLTSSDVNTFLMRQAVITCTSSTRPASPSEGMTIYETDTDLYATYTGSAWRYVGGFIDWTPTLDSTATGWSFGNASVSAAYTYVGNFIFGHCDIVWGSTSTFGATNLSIDLPVTRAGDFHEPCGIGTTQDISTGNGYMLVVQEIGNNFWFQAQANAVTYSSDATVTSTIPFAWNGSDGDKLGFSFFYEAA